MIDRRKLVDYALSPDHEDGKHKARVFASALGLSVRDADVLIAALRSAAATQDAERLWEDRHGVRYRIRFRFHFQERSAIICSGWRVPADGSQTRLTTAFIE